MNGGAAAVKIRTLERYHRVAMIPVDEILAARQRLAAHLPATPLLASPWLSELAGAEVRLKLESLQVSRSFKVRGALNALIRLSALEPRPVVVTASAGNHGRAIAWAAERLGLKAVVFTPTSAPQAKLSPIAGHGADLRAIADDYEDAERRAIAFATETGAVFVSPYNHDDVIAGGGTVALEILETWPEVEAMVVAVGGGGLISGIAIAAKDRATVSGAEVSASTPFTHSLAAGRIVSIDVCATVADGLSGNLDADTPTFELVRELVHEIAVVAESEVLEGVRFVAKEERLVIEGAAAVAVAAVRERKISVKGKRTAVVLSGANIDIKTFANILAS